MLIDHAFATESCLPRQDRHAIGFDATIAAAFADLVVDENTALRLRQKAAFAAPSLFRGAHLVVNEHRHAADVPQFPLHGIDLVAVTDRRAGYRRMAARLIGHDHDFSHALCKDLPDNAVDAQRAVMPLATGHRHGIVVEDFKGDVDAGRHAGPDRQQARMIVCTVAHVLEHVAPVAERQLADPVGAVCTHLGIAVAAPIHPHDHVVAPRSGPAAAAFGHHRRAIVRAAGAEIGLAREGQDGAVARGLARRELLELPLERLISPERKEAPADLDRNAVAG